MSFCGFAQSFSSKLEISHVIYQPKLERMEWVIVENTHDANREAMLMDLMQVRRMSTNLAELKLYTT